jgi:phenylalanyl-tRNA synthetase beta chain
LRTSLLPGLLATARRNVGRGAENLALFEIGHVYRPEGAAPDSPPQVGVAGRPSKDELSALQSLLPREPTRLAVLVCGERDRSGWWGPGRPASWEDTIEAADVALRACGVEVLTQQDEHAPWHPGRCAALIVDGHLVGHAGELHPDVVASYGLPPRTNAMELELDAALPTDEVIVQSPPLSPYPVAKEDVALVVDVDVPAGDVAGALVAGGGELVESVRLFDIYQGTQVGENKKSLAFSLRLRATDRTLSADEVALTRDAAVAEATRVAGAALRS